MTKAEIVEQIYEQVGFSKKESAELVEKVFQTIKETLAAGGRRSENGRPRLRPGEFARAERKETCCWAFLRSVMSWKMIETRSISPAALRIGETLDTTSISRPSLVRRLAS